MRPSTLLRLALVGCLSLALVAALVSLLFAAPSPADARVRALPRAGETETVTLTPSPSPTGGEASPTATATVTPASPGGRLRISGLWAMQEQFCIGMGKPGE